MRDRHWADISKNLGFELMPDETFTLEKVRRQKGIGPMCHHPLAR